MLQDAAAATTNPAKGGTWPLHLLILTVTMTSASASDGHRTGECVSTAINNNNNRKLQPAAGHNTLRSSTVANPAAVEASAEEAPSPFHPPAQRMLGRPAMVTSVAALTLPALGLLLWALQTRPARTNRDAACKIQAAERRRRVRLRFSIVKGAARCIQEEWRNWRQYLLESGLEVYCSAAYIQAAARGYMLRRRGYMLSTATKKIQAAARGQRVRALLRGFAPQRARLAQRGTQLHSVLYLRTVHGRPDSFTSYDRRTRQPVGPASVFARFGIHEDKIKKPTSAKKQRARKAKAPMQCTGGIFEASDGTLYRAEGPAAVDKPTLYRAMYGDGYVDWVQAAGLAGLWDKQAKRSSRKVKDSRYNEGYGDSDSEDETNDSMKTAMHTRA